MELLYVILALCCTALIFAEAGSIEHEKRQEQAGTPCTIFSGQSLGNGGRKISFVIDVSTSMETNDPNSLRFAAARTLDQALISQSEAKDGKKADLVAVVTFAGSASSIYPLGDPSGAEAVLKAQPLELYTNGDLGVKEAISQLTSKDTEPTANRTVIILLTDGLDNGGPSNTVTQIQRAGRLGIRVSYGFLNPLGDIVPSPQIRQAVFETGGQFITIDDATDQETFLSLLATKGLTAIDTPQETGSGNGTMILLPGITTQSQLPDSGEPAKFSYHARAGEDFNLTVRAIDPDSITATLRDPSTNNDIITAQSNETDPAFIEYQATTDMDLEILVNGNVTGNGSLFTIGLKSPFSGCPVPSPNFTADATTLQPFWGKSRLWNAVFTGFLGFLVAVH